MNAKSAIKCLSTAALFFAATTSLSTGLALADHAGSSDTELAVPVTPVERGRYLVTIAGCNDCHTPLRAGPSGPELDTDRMLSGHPESLEMPPAALPSSPWAVLVAGTNTAWSGPWGVSFTANLTPDRETGLGKWTLRNFVETIRTGRHLGRGRQVLPPMPIPMYKHMTDADLEAVFTYLQSIPPVRNRVPAPLPPAGSESMPGEGEIAR